jgi:hypothetical protein
MLKIVSPTPRTMGRPTVRGGFFLLDVETHSYIQNRRTGQPLFRRNTGREANGPLHSCGQSSTVGWDYLVLDQKLDARTTGAPR